MNLFNTSAIAALATTLSVGTAFAADLITVPTSTPAEMPIYEDAGFDWSGFYAGVYGGAQNGTTSGTQYGLGVQAGVNAQFDFYLLGAEVAVHGLTGGTASETTYGQVLGRAGLVVSDDVLIYAAGGYGIDLGPPDEQDVLLGGGVELAVTDTITVEAQYLHGFPLNNGGNAKDQFTVGANFHF
jgi:outer membrane immunogenic protein